MKQILYCVMDPKKFQEDEPVIGVGAQPIIFLNGSDLCAAVSDFDSLQTSFDVTSMITYHKAIEALFERVAIIPFRFKTLFNDKKEVIAMLEQNNDNYSKLLSRLDGMVEMGIRLVKAKPLNVDSPQIDNEFSGASDVSNPGMSYLKRRWALYSSESWIQDQKREFSEKCSKEFDGLFANFKSEASRLPEVQNNKNLILISLYFLVRKDLTQEFRVKFRELKCLITGKMLLSGPWPPYNFVVS
ncbi:MAG: GvpL/GvpF family gas vesicle protein [Desulfomonilaceae bacterium]